MKPATKVSIGILVSIVAVIGIVYVLSGLTYTCFGCGGVNTIELKSAIVNSGPLPTVPTCQAANSAYIMLTLKNPSAATNITSLIITGIHRATTTISLNTTITAYHVKSNGNICSQISATNQPNINANALTNLTVYFGGQPASTLVKGEIYNWVINFPNYQSIGGWLQAQ